jgi:polyisoprenyl-phosphate glycosyltransferase
MNAALAGEMEAVFVVDGSPDRCMELLRNALPSLDYPAQLLVHSRNFGSFPAIRTGLAAARGQYFGVMAADLQEPPEFLLECFRALNNDDCDVAIGTRSGRDDPWATRVASSIFWGLYRRLVVPDMPPGGVDIFACNRAFREQLLGLDEARSSLIAQIFWMGFRRKLIPYTRQAREHGKSAWTLRKKIDYMMDSIFAFTDYPVRLLVRVGAAGSAISVLLAIIVLLLRLTGSIVVPGYAATMLVVLFFGALNLLALGVIGIYAWRGYENSKHRPLAIVAAKYDNAYGVK